MSPTHTVLRNYEGLIVNYPEPGFQGASAAVEKQGQSGGVWELACGRSSVIGPGETNRGQRRQNIIDKRKKTPKFEHSYLFDL